MIDLLAAMDLPPAGHPMRPYAEQMTRDVHTVFYMLIGVLVALVALTVAFCIFAYQKWQERQEIRKHRSEVVDLTVACGAILASIKSRGVILEQVEAKKAEVVAQAAAEMKSAVAEVPEKTATMTKDAVLDALDKKSDSGTRLPRTDPLAGLGGTT